MTNNASIKQVSPSQSNGSRGKKLLDYLEKLIDDQEKQGYQLIKVKVTLEWQGLPEPIKKNFNTLKETLEGVKNIVDEYEKNYILEQVVINSEWDSADKSMDKEADEQWHPRRVRRRCCTRPNGDWDCCYKKCDKNC